MKENLFSELARIIAGIFLINIGVQGPTGDGAGGGLFIGLAFMVGGFILLRDGVRRGARKIEEVNKKNK